jgi:hypothetical protein
LLMTKKGRSFLIFLCLVLESINYYFIREPGHVM